MSSDLIKRLEEIESSLAPAPWSPGALSDGIRHVQRNTDVMEDALEYCNPPENEWGLPNRHDGGPLARLRNMLPEIITSLKAREIANGTPKKAKRVKRRRLCHRWPQCGCIAQGEIPRDCDPPSDRTFAEELLDG